MNTKHAEYKTEIGRLAEDAAKRDNRPILVIVGTILAAASLATAVLGVIITGT